MRYTWVLLLMAIVTFGAACSDDGLCGDDSGEALIEVDAAALTQAGSQLKVCINDLCNDLTSTSVSVAYSGEHPSFAVYTVDRLTGSTWESIAGGRVELSCDRDPTSLRITIDADGTANMSGSSLQGG